MKSHQSHRDRYGLLDVDVESIVRGQDLVYENGATCWQDGHILGNGNLGVIGYAPYGLEWVLNKNDVFDGRTGMGKLLPHREVMKRFLKDRPPNLMFLDKLERPPKGAKSPLSKSAAMLNLSFGDEYYWGAARAHQVRQRLCLWEGELYYEMHLHASHPRLRCFVPRCRNVFCIRLEHSGGALWNKSLTLSRPPDEDLRNPEWRSEDGLMVLRQAMPDGAVYAVAVQVAPTTGPDRGDVFNRQVAPRYRVKGSSVGRPTTWTYHGSIPQFGNADIFVSVFTSYESKDPVAAAVAEVRRASHSGFSALERENRRWWRGYWEKSWADFGVHSDIQKYWTFCSYETACLLGKAPVPGLYGLWYGPTRGPRQGIVASDYTHDQNVQIPMMPVCPLNHLELIEPFADTYLNVLPELKRHTRELFGRGGAFLPLGMNQLGMDKCAGSYRYSLCGGAYSGMILAWAWRYGRDVTLLRKKLYPLLVEFVRFYVGMLAKGDDGRYHLDWCIPPELFTMSRDDTATLAMLKPCLDTVIEASRMFNRDSREREVWENIVGCYPEFPRRACGDWWAGKDIPEDHYTQAAYLLYPFFPAEVCTDQDGEHTAALTLRNSVYHDIELSYADQNGRWHYDHAWAWFFPIMTRLRLGQAKAGWRMLKDGIRLYCKPNGLFSHNPVVALDPQITEANLGRIPRRTLRHSDGSYSPLSEVQYNDACSAATLNPNAARWVTPATEGNAAFLLAATETLLQSHGGLIRLFPAVPRGFSGVFYRLLAQGAFEVSAEMKQGRVTRVKIKSLAGGTACLANPWRNGSACVFVRGGRPRALKGATLALNMKAGETVTLVCGRPPKHRAIVCDRKPGTKTRKYPDGTIVMLGSRRNG